MNYRHFGHCLSQFMTDIVVLHQASGVVPPYKYMLHNPPFQRHHEVVRFGIFDQGDQSVEHDVMVLIKESAFVPAIHKHCLNRTQKDKQANQFCLGIHTILNSDGIRHHGQQKSHRGYRNVLFMPFYFFTRIEIVWPRFGVVLTDSKSTIATVAFAFHSVLFFIGSRKVCITQLQVLFNRQWRKYPNTLLCYG